MGHLKKWECKAGVFLRVQYFTLISCPKLKEHLPEQLVSLETLEIRDYQQLEASAPMALHWQLYDCGKLQLDWGTMKELNMKAPLLEIVGSDTLEYLNITLESISDDCVFMDLSTRFLPNTQVA